MTRTIGPGPDPNQIYPMHPYNKLVFLKNFIKASNIHIGDYTYFDDNNLALISSLDVDSLEEVSKQG